QGRNIKYIDQDAEIALVNEAQGRMHDVEMFGVDDLEENEVFVDVRKKTVEKEVSTAGPVTIAGEVVTTASVEDSVAPTSATTADGYSGNVTPLFETMMVIAQKEVGEGSGLHTDSHHTPTDTQPSTSQPHKKMKPKRKQRQAAKVHSPSSEIPVKESVLT
nr:hypothetical protein [Tanacetum cinerariifolium]